MKFFIHSTICFEFLQFARFCGTHRMHRGELSKQGSCSHRADILLGRQTVNMYTYQSKQMIANCHEPTEGTGGLG